MKKSLKELNKQKPSYSKKNQSVFKTWKGQEESDKLSFLSDTPFPSQCASGVGGTSGVVERFLTFLFWKTYEDMYHKGHNKSEEGEDEDDTED